MKGVVLVSFAAILLIVASPGTSLECYTCLFPTISPIDCVKFSTHCGPSQRCMTSVTTGRKGSFELKIHEKSCGDPSMCDLHGTRYMLGTNFTYYTSCCSTKLCNRAAGKQHFSWELLMLIPLSIILFILH